jgi:mannosyltransferase
LFVLGIGTLLLAFLYSKVTPAWALRYLAVIVGPLLVLFGLGLVRGGRLGLVGLVLCMGFWVLDPIPPSRDYKSNVASVAAKVRSTVSSDALVVSTQPEQVPTLAYYLRGAHPYLTPLGTVRDPGVVDWRNALSHLHHASVRSTLMPVIASLPPGRQVLLVVPVQSKKSPLWLKLIAHDSHTWSRALARDPSLRRIAAASPHAYATGVGLSATLYVVR